MQELSLMQYLNQRVMVFDGAMGTMLQALAYRQPWCPDHLNLLRPEVVEQVHAAYVAAGSDIIQTNTFGATRLKLALYSLDDQVELINRQAVAIARRAAGTRCFVAGSIGPTGQLLEPYGSLTADECYAAFLEQATALAAAGVDLINVETMSDILEAKLAAMAARQAMGDRPVFCSVTFDRGLRTLTGATPEVAAVTLSALGVDVIGANCGGGPEEVAQAGARLMDYTQRPVLLRPNAGLPHGASGGRENAGWDVSPAMLGAWAAAMAERGAAIIGGCCGTSPEHIAAIAQAVKGRASGPRQPVVSRGSWLAGSGEVLAIARDLPTRIIGERLNPTSRPELQQALAEGNWDVYGSEARAQGLAGADLVDVNTGHRVPGRSEAGMMRAAVLAVQKAFLGPVVIDSRDHAALEQGLLVSRGKPLINSTTADPAALERVLGLARRFGAAVIGLPMAEGKVPEDLAGRTALASRIAAAAETAGLPLTDVYIDGLVLAASVHASLARVTLDTVEYASRKLGVRTVLGLSNISFGLPARDHFNAAYVALAAAAGVDMVIANPQAAVLPGVLKAADVLNGRDPRAQAFVNWATRAAPVVASVPAVAAARVPATAAAAEAGAVSTESKLAVAIRDGESNLARSLALELLGVGRSSIDVIDAGIVPGLEAIGAEYEARRAFLPQLLLAAEAAQAAFTAIAANEGTASAGRRSLGKVVLATVKGDMHDIGKNIVAMLMRSHGFEVIDLGRDVAPEAVVEAVRTGNAGLVGLSALMTTTMPEMEATCNALRQAGLQVPVLVGGAVVTADFAAAIGASYAPDAVSGVRMARQLIWT